MSTYAARLRFARDQRHLTQVSLARLSGVSRETIARIETGAIERPHLATVDALAAALRVNGQWLWGRQVPMAHDLWYVYWFTDEHHRIIYVGMTGNPIGRFAQHRYQPWAAEIDKYAYQVFATYDDAAATERAAIVALRPCHNVKDKPRLIERTKLVR